MIQNQVINSSVSDDSITASLLLSENTYTVGWNDPANFRKYFSIQNAELSRRDFTPGIDKCTESVVQSEERFQLYFQDTLLSKWPFFISNLPENAKVVDIGCGCAVSDLLLAQHNPTAQFWLYDEEGWFYNPDVLYMDNSPYRYHSWSVVEDGIQNSGGGLDRDRFTFCNPSDDLPSDVDLIYSMNALGMHQGLNDFNYLNRIKDSLKVGGRLMLDIVLTPDFDLVDMVCEAMNSEMVLERELKAYDSQEAVNMRPVSTPLTVPTLGGLKNEDGSVHFASQFVWIKR
jgi:hypothetical protein